MKTIIALVLAVLTLMGCQYFRGSRKPQAAGFGGYCPTCVVKNIDKDLVALQKTFQNVKHDYHKNPKPVDQVIMFDKKGKPVCYVDLHKHPELLPHVMKLNKKEMVQVRNKQDRRPASTEDLKLPMCTGEYLAQLKKAAKSSVTVNGKKSHLHKTGILSAFLYCVTGAAIGAAGAFGLSSAEEGLNLAGGADATALGAGILLSILKFRKLGIGFLCAAGGGQGGMIAYRSLMDVSEEAVETAKDISQTEEFKTIKKTIEESEVVQSAKEKTKQWVGKKTEEAKEAMKEASQEWINEQAEEAKEVMKEAGKEWLDNKIDEKVQDLGLPNTDKKEE